MTETLPTPQESLLELLEETFEKPQGYYLDRAKGGLFGTLEGITSEVASRPVAQQHPTIAAHCEHLRFYLDVLYRAMHGDTARANWDESWRTQTVTASEWDGLRAAIRFEYDRLMTELRAMEAQDTRLETGMSVLAHTAYHLGAIRQLIPRGAT
jgi:DinB superfamily